MNATMRKWKCLGMAIFALAGFLGISTTASAASADDLSLELDLLRQDVSQLGDRLTKGLRLNGYYDFEYLADNEGGYAHFRQHHISLFIARDWETWRLFTELEWEDGTALKGDGVPPATGTGEIKMERGWVEYLPSDAINVRMGKILLPHYWNVNHYPNVVLSTNRPLMVRNIYPTDTTGIMVYGTVYRGSMGATYRMYAGNGQSANDARNDDNVNKATGGRLTFHLGGLIGLNRLDVSGSGYSEQNATDGAFDVWGADAQVNVGRVELLAEYASRTANTDTEGFYVQPSARIAGELRAFYRFDSLDNGAFEEWRQTVGLNYRPEPNISLKVEVSDNDSDDPTTTQYEEVAASIALFF